MICSLSKLKENEINEVNVLEKDLGKTLLAFSCHNMKIADLNENELKRLKALESKMGVSLVAVEK